MNIRGLFARHASGHTRFERARVLRNIPFLMKKLKEKEGSLREGADPDVADAQWRKSCVMSSLVRELDNLVEEYNQLPDAEGDDLKVILEFVQALQRSITLTLCTWGSFLRQHRSDYKSKVRTGVSQAAEAGAVFVGLFTRSLTVYFASRFAAPSVSGAVNKILDVADERTASVRLLEDLSKELDCVCEALGHLVDGPDFAENFLANSPLECPITGEEMVRPVLCTLDGRMYERQAIETWLSTHRTSPINRAEMKPQQRVEDVLVENLTLRNALEACHHKEMQLHMEAKR